MDRPKQLQGTKPKPFKSPIWEHAHTIKEMRKAGSSWTQIRDELAKGGHQFHHTTLCNFWKRNRRRLSAQEKPARVVKRYRENPDQSQPKPKALEPIE